MDVLRNMISPAFFITFVFFQFCFFIYSETGVCPIEGERASGVAVYVWKNLVDVRMKG